MSRYVVQASWDDVPHLTEEAKKELWESLPPHQREARKKGIPCLGAGAIYPVPEEDIVISPIKLPGYWPKAYALDVGWKCTAAIWGAWDRDNDIIYAYSEHYRGQCEPAVHASAIQARGKWIKGAIDPAARGRNQKDGERLMDIYEGLGLNLIKANNAVEAGIQEVYQRLSTGRLKIFSTLTHLISEYRIYHRNEKGRIVKQNDHALDALRYLVMSLVEIASLPTQERTQERPIIQNIIADKTIGY